MTDSSFEQAGELSPADSDFVSTAVPESTLQAPAAEEAQASVPSEFALLGLAPELLAAVTDMGFTQPTTVQKDVIPRAMLDSKGSSKFIDLMVSSQTGSGKTAAFLLPVLHTLLQQQAQAEAAARAEREKEVADALARGEEAPKRPKRKSPMNPRHFTAATPGALVLCPTRELAQQVAHDAIELVKHCRGLRIANVVGGMPYALQIAKLQNADLVVATPGRLLDLQRSSQIKLDQVQFLVVDEADRMLDLGFSDDLAAIHEMTIERKQTMMFSATFAPRIQQLASRVMREPQRVQIDSPQEKHQNIRQVLFWADNPQHKRKLLDHWLRDASIAQAIVFCSTQIECDGLANDLQQDGFSAVALHGALSQGLRNRRLMALRQGQVQILVATDVAARGIDVPSISHVFNYGLPMKAEDYTHRIGRTGRAGRDGLAITFAEFRDRRRIQDIESFSRQQFTSEVIPGLEPRERMPEFRRPSFGRDSQRPHAPRGRPAGGGYRGDDRGADRGGFGGAPRHGSYNPHGGRPAPARPGRDFAGADDGFAPRRESREDGGFASRAGQGAPRGSQAAFGKPAGGPKVFVPRDAMKKRPARSGSR